MTPERWREVLRLHAAAAALPESERAAFLARECPDEELRAEVRRMLAAPDTDAFLEPPALDQPAAGRDLGDFSLLEEIGRGGMGVVYRALQRSLGRIVAVKVLPASFALPQRTIERFEREARTMARLAHPNLVSILAFGEERGLRYLAMEYVDGPSLAQELLRLRADLGAEDDRRAHLPSSRASDYFRSVAESVRQVADGLAFSHEHGIVHRDVKPSNLLLDPSGRVKVVDFGLARDEHLGSLSTSGDLVGTPHYMSPEQARAHRHVVDHRTDIYSLGVVLFELLTLQRPFEGNTSQEVIANLLHKEPPRLRRLNPRVPHDLETICLTAMAREVTERYVDAKALRGDLARFLAHEAIVARPPGVAARVRRFVRRRRFVVSIAVAALCALSLGWGMRGFLHAAEEAYVSVHAPGFEGALVWDVQMDPLWPERSAVRALGRVPLSSAHVPLGLHRFVIEVPGFGFAELTRHLRDPGRVHELRPTLRETGALLEPRDGGMVAIPAGPFVFGWDGASCPQHMQRRMIDLPAFWIDRYEVSNRQYLEFLRATSRPWPALWPVEGSAAWEALPEGWLSLPVTGVSYHDARDYAEWSGRRLPTQWEWEKAARGREGFELPWQRDSEDGSSPSAAERAVVARPYRAHERRFENYLERCAPVDSHAIGRSPFGLHHVLGNAQEWTESLWYATREDGGIVPNWETHVLKGGGFHLPAGGWNLSAAYYGPADDQVAVQTLGFRCAKSAAPLPSSD